MEDFNEIYKLHKIQTFSDANLLCLYAENVAFLQMIQPEKRHRAAPDVS